MRGILTALFLSIMFGLLIAGWVVRWWAHRLATRGEDPSERELVRFFAIVARDPYFGREYARPGSKQRPPTPGGEQP